MILFIIIFGSKWNYWQANCFSTYYQQKISLLIFLIKRKSSFELKIKFKTAKKIIRPRQLKIKKYFFYGNLFLLEI